MIKRRRLPETRQGVTHKFTIGGERGYITVGFYEDGTVGELFVKMDRQGSSVSGFIDAWAMAVSMLLQTGWSLEQICDKYRGFSFEPAGLTDNPEIRVARSPIDYIARWLALKFLAQPVPVVQSVPVIPRPNAFEEGGFDLDLLAKAMAEPATPGLADGSFQGIERFDPVIAQQLDALTRVPVAAPAPPLLPDWSEWSAEEESPAEREARRLYEADCEERDECAACGAAGRMGASGKEGNKLYLTYRFGDPRWCCKECAWPAVEVQGGT